MKTIRKSIYLAAEKATVWAFLTEVEKVKTWFHVYDADLAEGRAFTITGQESGKQLGEGRVTQAKPHDLLEYTFAIGPMQGLSSTVLWTLQEVTGGTRLSLEHSGLSDDLEAFALILALDKGWDEHLGEMRAAIAG